MKVNYIVLLSLLLAIYSCTEDSSPVNSEEDNINEIEYSVYSSTLNYLNTIGDYSYILLRDSTVGADVSVLYDDIQANFDSIEIETIDDYQLRNSEIVKLQNIDSLSLQFTFISDSITITNWRDNFPDAKLIISISRVGFNSDRNQALLYYAEYLDLFAASGYLVFLEKSDTWVVKKLLMLWIS